MRVLIVENGQGIHVAPDNENDRSILLWMVEQQNHGRKLQLDLIGRPLAHTLSAEAAIESTPFIRAVLEQRINPADVEIRYGGKVVDGFGKKEGT